MTNRSGKGWVAGLVFILVLVAVPVWYFTGSDQTVPGQVPDSPWDNVPRRTEPVAHDALMEGPFETGQQVTQACLDCHEDAADQVIHTAHWRWESNPVVVEGRAEPITVGKKNAINNFCIGIQANWPPCTACHAGYGWVDETYDFTVAQDVDCLVCHDTTGEYKKIPGLSGHPNYERMEWPPHSGKFREPVDLKKVAQNVGKTSRATCGANSGEAPNTCAGSPWAMISPWLNSTTRSAAAAASSTSCVTSRIAMPCSRQPRNSSTNPSLAA